MKCKYEGRQIQYKCEDECWKDSDYCILHTDFPKDRNSDEFNIIKKEKERVFKQKIDNEDYIFHGAKLYEINLQEAKIGSYINLIESEIVNGINFNGAEINGHVIFNLAKIGGIVTFDGKFEPNKKTIINGNLLFKGAEIGENAFFRDIDITGDFKCDTTNFNGVVRFNDANINGEVWLIGSNFGNYVDFRGVTMGGSLLFNNSKVGRFIDFSRAKIEYDTHFNDTEVTKDATFIGTKIGGSANFKKIRIHENANFRGARIGGSANFDGAIFEGDFIFDGVVLEGEISFNDTQFESLKSKEKAYRRAKAIFKDLGDKETADDYFYNEMILKRLQKPWFIRYPEWIVQIVFGYGVHPFRVILIWLSVVLVFTVFYWDLNAIQPVNSPLDYLYFSITTAATPGYGGYNLTPGTLQSVLAICEAIFGTFMWAAIIATFAKKYMTN